MILTDAGPLVALIDDGEPDHDRCVAALDDLSGPMLVTWPVFTEAMYLLDSVGGPSGRRALWELHFGGDLRFAELSDRAIRRSERLMEQYSDTPMDLADATLVAVAEEMGERRVFTLDSDFDVYRLHGRYPFERLPG